jgi:hypothetical protein
MIRRAHTTSAALFLSATFALFGCCRILAQTPAHAPAMVIARTGRVEFRRLDPNLWYPAPAGHSLFERDHLRTLADGRATVEMEDLSQLRVNPQSEFIITPPRSATAKRRIEVLSGLLYFLHRNQPGEIDVDTPVGATAIEGTEFVLNVEPGTGKTVLTLIDGHVRMTNDYGYITLTNGEQGTMEHGKAPTKTAVINAQNAVQWCLYYPGVINPDDLHLDSDIRSILASSLAAYRDGDLIGALANYPANRTPAGGDERLFLAALQLSSGRATNLDLLISNEDASHPLAKAIRLLAAAVRSETMDDSSATNNASQWLARSYYRQSQRDLKGALNAAQNAVSLSTNFAFGWERVAELEFSFGHVPAAERALDRALLLGPRNAQAYALRGFLFLARSANREAEASFARATELDPMLANAWLGRGLEKIREGRATEGRMDLETAAVLEPDRWLLRSYLGKAYAHEALFTRDPAMRRQLQNLATNELDLAMKRDPLDPTPWLYSALLLYDNYHTADAIHDLEQSERLSDNRMVYRSKLLLDQDQAVRSANLANIFQDAQMADVSVRESARAVAFDYANFSAHLNLAGSFNQLRDPTRFNLRFESEWFNEHLLANLLAPVGAGSLSQDLSQQEYSRLFVANRVGLHSTTEYFSDGQFRETASQFGTFGGTSYALDLEYQHNDGVRVNNDLSRIEWYSRIKQQLTPDDSVLLLAKYQDFDSGDNFQYYDPSASARPSFRFREMQTPLLLAGWHHEWSPGVHTLFLGGRLMNDQHLSDTNAAQLVAVVNPAGVTDPTTQVPFNVHYRSQFTIYSAELNQIFQRERHTDIFGVRYQNGNFKADATLSNPPPPLAPLFSLPEISSVDGDFQRISLYAYHHWEIVDGLLLIGGVAFDDLKYPSNFRRPPLNNDESEKQRWLPKAALVWQAAPEVTVRGAFSRAVGGVSYDESVRLEPTQLAGFDQSFRSIISESLVGSVEAPDYQIAGGALDLKPWTNTWLSFQAESLEARVRRQFGLFNFDFFGSPPMTPGQTPERLDYHEIRARAILDQIIGREWFLEAQYQFTHSELDRRLPTIPATPAFDRTASAKADLHEARLSAMWLGQSGFFSRGEFWWFAQNLGGSGPKPEGDSFPQLNFYAGYRFPNRRGELTFGVLNLTDENYHLSPLNYYLELPRERVFYTRFSFNF